MKDILKPGDTRQFRKHVTQDDTARFDSGEVHPVYATFALARDAEWCCRLFVLDVKEEQEEGIGTMIHIDHLSPALVGNDVVFTATLKAASGNDVICTFEARVGERLIATGEQGQKVLTKEKIARLFRSVS